MDDAALRLAPASLWLAMLWVAETFVNIPKPGRVRHGIRNLMLAACNGLVLFFTLGAVSIWVCSRSLTPDTYSLRAIHAIVAFIGLDLFSYCWHRLVHVVPVLWRFHSVHHCDDQMDVTTAGRFHIAELTVGAVLRLPVLYFLAVTPSILLAYETTLLIVSMFHHSSIVLGRRDRILRLLITTPLMHSVHHSRDPEDFGSNFASVFSVWDRLFSTYRTTGTLVSHGLDGADGKPFSSLLAMPFRREQAASVGPAVESDGPAVEQTEDG